LHLQEKAAAGIPFSDLHEGDWNQLVRMLSVGHNENYVMSIDICDRYVCKAWTKDRLAQVWAVSDFNPLEKRCIPYMVFYESPPNTGPDGSPQDDDPRVAARAIPHDLPFDQKEPVIVVRMDGFDILLEGYLRSILFMRSNDPAAVLLVWAPCVPTQHGAR
jgi:hypothetical protein